MAARRLLPKTKRRELFQRLRERRDRSARETLILAHQRLAVYVAKKFADRGESLEDLIQVAQLGLIKAIDRYDPSRGIEFTTYATPTIIGEIKRHFRDKLWPVHVPRRLRELNYALMRSVEGLSQRLGRSPTIAIGLAKLAVQRRDRLFQERAGAWEISLRGDRPGAGQLVVVDRQVCH